MATLCGDHTEAFGNIYETISKSLMMMMMMMMQMIVIIILDAKDFKTELH
jgi:hypothetical protein